MRLSPRLIESSQIGTPVYMSPQLISVKSSRSSYDAVKVSFCARRVKGLAGCRGEYRVPDRYHIGAPCSSRFNLLILCLCLNTPMLFTVQPPYFVPLLKYSPGQADIWACAVLLYVSLFGMFPYDHTKNPDPNTESAHSEVRGKGILPCIQVRETSRLG